MASRFWVGGTGTWDAADTTHWAASSGGAGGQSVPVAGDDVTFDGSSGGGTVTVSHASLNVATITCGAFTGTLDFATNDNNVTLTGATAFSGSGSGTRTINLGDGTWTLSGAGAVWTIATTTNLTFNAGASTISFTSTSANTKQFLGGGLTYNNVSIAAVSGAVAGRLTVTGANTYNVFTIGAGRLINFINSVTQTMTSLVADGTAASPIGIHSASIGGTATISISAGTITITYAMYIRDITFAGGATFVANKSFDYGGNSGITINRPSFGGGGIIGG